MADTLPAVVVKSPFVVVNAPFVVLNPPLAVTRPDDETAPELTTPSVDTPVTDKAPVTLSEPAKEFEPVALDVNAPKLSILKLSELK